MKKRKKAVLCAILSAMMLSSAMPEINISVFATTPISETEALSQAVELYEQLSGNEVEIPEGMEVLELDIDTLKSVVLGFVNFEDTEETLQEQSIRKQDFMTILYKTIITYNDSYTIYEDEANAILNECYDNAYIDDENRIAYAFMMKQGIITKKFGSEPNKELTKEECDTLISTVYDYFAQNVVIRIGENEIVVGDNIDTVLEQLGEPNRIDETEYGFEWYVYNEDYRHFSLIGVEADRVCAVFTNCVDFEFNSICSGDDYAQTADYIDNLNFRFYADSDGRVDSFMYNPRPRGLEDNTSIKRSKSMLLLDIINSYRSKNEKPIYIEDSQMSSEVWLSTLDFMDAENYNMVNQSGYDIFSVYRQLLEADNEILMQDTMYSTPVGLSTTTDMSGRVHASIMTDVESVAPERESEKVLLEEKDYSINKVEEITEPVLVLPTTENMYDEGDDIVIQLESRSANQYHIEMFDVENDEYAVNEYITTDKTEIILPAELFEAGEDYSLRVSSLNENGEALSADEVFISYGSIYDSGVEIITPYNNGIIDGDYLSIMWESEKYHDFYVDLYNEDGLVVSKIVEDEYEALIQGVEPGTYYLYVTALRRGTKVEKAQDVVTIEVECPEPVIDEIILDKDDKYYFVYEDEELGLIYFYDEDLIEVEENRETVTKKKIIRKRVKSTRGYRQLSRYRTKPEYTTGDPTIRSQHLTPFGETGSAILAEAEKYLGVPYVWGGTTPDGFDCSGLVQYVCKSLGITVSRVAEDQFKNGTPVSYDELQPGDLVFFEKNGYIHHVGIYAGGGMMLHAPRTGEVVQYQSIETDYYRSEYAGARRVY